MSNGRKKTPSAYYLGVHKLTNQMIIRENQLKQSFDLDYYRKRSFSVKTTTIQLIKMLKIQEQTLKMTKVFIGYFSLWTDLILIIFKPLFLRCFSDLPTCLMCVCLTGSVYCEDISPEMTAVPALPQETAYLYARFNKITKITNKDFANIGEGCSKSYYMWSAITHFGMIGRRLK